MGILIITHIYRFLVLGADQLMYTHLDEVLWPEHPRRASGCHVKWLNCVRWLIYQGPRWLAIRERAQVWGHGELAACSERSVFSCLCSWLPWHIEFLSGRFFNQTFLLGAHNFELKTWSKMYFSSFKLWVLGFVSQRIKKVMTNEFHILENHPLCEH